MTLTPCACFFLKRNPAILAAGVTLLAWVPPTPARGQCSPQELSKLIASDGAAIDEFGFNVALSGDTAVIGAFLDDYSGFSEAGSAYVFIRSGALWTQQAKLIPADAANNDNFGAGVAVEGDTAVVGSYTDDHTTGNDQGSAYVFIRSGTVWTQAAKLTASDATTDDLFGWSVAISGDTVLIGAYGDDTAAGSTAGSAYVFVKPPGGWTNMTQTAKLTPSDAAETDEFGYAVALSGDTAVVGAVLDNINGGPGDIFDGHGSAYVFVRSGGVWTQQAKLTASDAAGMDNFGVSVAVSGDTVMIGANRADTPGVANTGGVYVFVKPGGGWVNMTETVKFTASDAAASDQFGYSVAMSGDRVVIGAALEDNAGGSNAGSAYVFDLNCVAVCCAGDFDNNNVVTSADIADFVAALLAAGPCPILPACCPADFNADGTIDGRDVPGFLAKLLSGGVCP